MNTTEPKPRTAPSNPAGKSRRRPESRKKTRIRRRNQILMGVVVVELLIAALLISRRARRGPEQPSLADAAGPVVSEIQPSPVPEPEPESEPLAADPENDSPLILVGTDRLTPTPSPFTPYVTERTTILAPLPVTLEANGELDGETASGWEGGAGESLPNGETADSQFLVLMDAGTGEILAARLHDALLSPASMTKVLTLLTAVEYMGDSEGWFTMTRDITDYCYVNGCSIAGFLPDETVPVRDLLYGCILPSGADAAIGLAEYTAGSQESFVALMNAKLAELGRSGTARFSNCVGLFDPAHYCTVTDIACVMRAALDNPVCREILDARQYQTSPTDQHPADESHPGGIALSNWFLRRIEDRFEGTSLQIRGGKTGYVRQAGSCAVSYAVRDDGKTFLCVTANAPGAWRVIYDHTALYQSFCLP